MAEPIQIRGNTFQSGPPRRVPTPADMRRGRAGRDRQVERENEERNLLRELQEERAAKAQAAKEAPWEGRRINDNPLITGKKPQTLEDLQNLGRPTNNVPPPSADGMGIDWNKVAESNPEATVQEESLPVAFVSPQEAAVQDFAEKIANPEVTPDQYEPGATDVPMGEGVVDQFADAAADEVPAVTEEELTAAVESDEDKFKRDGLIDKMTLDGRPMGRALTDDTGAAGRGLLDDIDGNLDSMMDEYSTKDVLEGKVVNDTDEAIQGGGNNADLEAVAADEGLEDVPEEMGGMMNVEEEQAPIFSDEDQAGYLEKIRMKKVINSYLSRIGKGPMGEKNGISRDKLIEWATTAAIKARENGENPVLAIGRALRENTMDAFADREIQRQINYDKMIEQQHKSRRWGVPIGLIQAADVLGAARTPEERRAAYGQIAVMFPNLGKDMQFNNTRRGVSSQQSGQMAGPGLGETLLNQMAQVDAAGLQALSQQGGEQLPEEKNPEGTQSSLYDGTGDILSSDNLQKFYAYARNEGFEPERAIEEAAVRFNGSLQSVKEKVQSGQLPSVEEAATVRNILLKISTNPSKQHFEMLFGPLDQDTYVRLKRVIFAKEDTTMEDWGRGIGSGLRGFVEGAWDAGTGVAEGVSGE